MPKHMLLTEEVATQLRVSTDTVRDWVRQGRLRAHRINPRGPLLFDPSDVEASLRAATPTIAAATAGSN